ncbi:MULTISPECIES: ABC transporter ATP-binding protein [Helcococcus]|uniref:Putative hemin import ATP-binding protein HrtA n=1 Tax=Helcococcus bovis TaxID=3153252 RepID=A0ABW9F7H9_9FIRM
MSEIIRFEKVNKEFQDGNDKIEALKETSFSVNSGELVAIIGPSGSGKSTLLTMMGGLQKPTNGKIFFNGQDISELNEKDRNSLRFDKIGFILQASNLVPFLKISEQFELVDKFNKTKHNKEKAKSIMEKFGIYNRKDQYPGDLSGGERQRAAIARALYPEPNLILADEPTASLDTNRAMDVVKILKEITEDSNRTTIMVTHDNRLLKYCDRVFKIVDGKMSEEFSE